jgi:opacity protein-like surface antigen
LGTGLSGSDQGIAARLPWLSLIQGQVGVSEISTGGRPLTLYLAGGLAFGRLAVSAGGVSDDKVMAGYGIGGGVDVQVTPSMSLGLLVEHFDLGSATMFNGTAPVSERGTLVLGRATFRIMSR